MLEVREALLSGWLTTGPKVRQFEVAFGAAVGATHAVAVNSCTAALHLALAAIGLRQGDEVLVPAYTFAATAEVVRYFDARPVLVDSDPLTLNMDPVLMAAAVTPRTRAIIPVHFAGLAVELEAVCAVAREHDLRVIEDAAHAFPATYQGRKIGALSDFTCFSFYATKTLTTGEGGMLCTEHAHWAEQCRMLALHGISRDAWKRYAAEGSWYYEITAPGFKYNMGDLAAALGLAQLRKAEAMHMRRAATAERYNAAFAALPELQLPSEQPGSSHAWHLYVLRLNLERLTIDRTRFIEELRALQIGVSVHFIPLHIHPYYREMYGYRPDDFPVAYGQYLRSISLPIYSKMSDADVADVITAVTALATRYRR
ncbi:MAG: DegT/DnrJ/EryC1/StrS family aminotransferase [Candidatus Viridilinea halotolerans]|uniref:DegT/DnrJ/EryC1/StrS family aminotransferase n=1 Tax=Candidatus Viridilinea halotolerans TaxID=2491704 RepID=A0A426UCB1_9CHLR|nr:MAG: DegT/DnrJ/EryC1/StrS family aminotransferase [Candidatus Viridilinea halotolerans]